MNPIASGFARVNAAQPALPLAHHVTVECDVVKGLHTFTLVGLPDKAVEESKDRISSAIKNCGFESPKRSNKKIVLSLAPAELKKEGAVFDVPLALAFLLASRQVTVDVSHAMFCGELGLDGAIRPIHGAVAIAALAKREGIREVFVPSENAEEASLIEGVAIYGIAHLQELIALLQGTKRRAYARAASADRAGDDAFDEIRGQHHAKRALIIAAAGMHNAALFGPPGTGKTLLARATASILPDLTEDEIVEVTTIHSLSSRIGAVTRPPYRAPHHTSSYASLIGGGSGSARPGEVTLAHRGVLFLDEFPEFRRDVIQALREPLEDGVVSIARARQSATYPADFMLIAALNPCPCGYAGSARCECMPHLIEKYRRKIQGPIADRIDIWIPVGEMPLTEMSMHAARSTGETVAARESVARARARQRVRFKDTRVSANAGMTPRLLESHAALSRTAEKQLLDAATRLKLSARGYHRTIKLARTIADLADSDSIEPAHMLEALQYRSRPLDSH